MATPTKYTHSITSDFGGAFDPDNWESEIRGESSGVLVQLDHVKRAGDVIDTWFKDVLTAGEITALDALPAAHDSVPSFPPDQVELAGAPKTSDGKIIFQPAVFRGDQNPVYVGAADDFAAGARGSGYEFLVQQAEDSDGTPHVYEWQFIDAVYIFSGEAKCFNGVAGDWVNFSLVAPGSVKVANGGGLGNCNAVPTGAGSNVLVPAAGDGGYDVNLTEAANANLNAKPQGCPAKVTKAVPVPAFADDGTPNGYWDWDEETGAITASSTPGAAPWNLFDAEITLNRWVNRLQLWSPEATHGIAYKMQIPTKAKKILPHWKFRVEVLTGDANRTVSLTWFLVIGRKVTS